MLYSKEYAGITLCLATQGCEIQNDGSTKHCLFALCITGKETNLDCFHYII